MSDPVPELLGRARRGDAAAGEQLLALHRPRLRRMVALHLDRRLLGRVDSSDVVQEALADAWGRLPQFFEQPLPFYPWLRQIAWNRLIDCHRRHVGAARRSVLREEAAPPLPDDSALELAQRLAASDTGPGDRAVREEERLRVRDALARLGDRDRQVLVLRHLEDLSMAEVAAVLGVSENGAKVRHLRALDRLRRLLAEGAP